ncbi:hypothetical protein [Brevundimonas sp.]|uniref:hypothetical protein n=1 Tax=Brevundimonas sp. TaxID=1871086 RepID=UPI00289F3DB6|nr:hypothetical protein [Brevundimonas sp.]
MIFSIVHFVLGLALILRPQWFAGLSEGRRRRRLATLNAGATETFFEEKRSLETYPARGGGLVLRRVLGAGMMVCTLLLGAREARAEATLSDCVWSHLSATEQSQILNAYGRGVTSGMNALNHRDLKVMAAAPACAGRADLPAMWVRSAVAAHVIQTGASASVLSEKGLDRARLDAAWDAAPLEARNCTLANAAKVFGIDGPACADRRAPRAFAESLGLTHSVRADRKAAEQTLIYMNAKAQEQIALTLIARMPPARQ